MQPATDHVIRFMGARKSEDRQRFIVWAGCTDCEGTFFAASTASIADARKAAYQRHRRNHKGVK